MRQSDYPKLLRGLTELSVSERTAAFRYLYRADLYFLILIGLGRTDIEHPWLFDRCKMVEQDPDGYLDLWAREHYKSTIITYAKTIQDILASHGDDPLECWEGKEPTFGIFSHTRPIAKGFLRQIKREFESNTVLREAFPDIIWANPQADSPKWSEDEGIVLKRKSNPKEGTVEAYGLVDGQPTSKHFDVLVYDDIVTDKSVHTMDMIRKTTDALALSYNLGAKGGKRRFIGTRYHFSDSYREVIRRETAIERRFPATEDGSIEGDAVFLDKESLWRKRTDMGPYIFSCQMMQDPTADATQSFKLEWLRYYDTAPQHGTNNYIVVDPAHEKKKENDYTSIWVIGVGEDGMYYCLDIIRDRLNLTERADLMFQLHKKWQPLAVGYEKYGMQSDIEHFEDRMNRENYRFVITPLGGQISKIDRIRKLIPLFEQHRIYLPKSLIKSDYQHRTYDAVRVFIDEEYEPFPVGIHPDMLDSLARIVDPDLSVSQPRTSDLDLDKLYPELY